MKEIKKLLMLELEEYHSYLSPQLLGCTVVKNDFILNKNNKAPYFTMKKMF